jgi:hypothetical protein
LFIEPALLARLLCTSASCHRLCQWGRVALERILLSRGFAIHPPFKALAFVLCVAFKKQDQAALVGSRLLVKTGTGGKGGTDLFFHTGLFVCLLHFVVF